MKLRISDDLVLGADYVVSTAGIFATKGLGKSHLAQVAAEEMLAHGQVVVAIDPTDAWWGLRASADGKSEGYPVVVIGGDHGDLPLEPGGAVQLAEAIVAERFSCVICTDGMSDMAETKFVREFLDTIYRKNRQPIHIFVDESDVFAPQKPFDVEDARCIRAMSHIVRRGRKKGIGSTLITQRPAELNASVRTMVEMLFVLGMSHNLDIDAVEKWMRVRKKKRGANVAFELQEAMIESLDSLQRGDAWVWAPRLGIHKRFRARAKRTFDSGATPRPGQKVKAPKKLAPVDLARLGQAMAAAVQRQKDNDPTELRKQVAALRKELASVGKGQDRAEANEKENHAENIELRAELEKLKKAKPLLKDGQIARVEKTLDRSSSVIASAQETLGSAVVRAEQSINELRSELQKARVDRSKSETLHMPIMPARPPRPVAHAPKREARLIAVHSTNGKNGTNGVQQLEGLQPAHLRLLTAIAWWESLGVPSPDLGGVAFAAKTSTTSSTFNNNRSKLNAAGYIDYPSPGHVRLTDAGREIAPTPSLPPTNEAFQGAVLERVQPAIQRLLSVLIEAYPKEVTLDEFAEGAGTSITSSTFNNNRSWLRARGLAEYPRMGFVRATPLLFPEGS